MTFDDAAFNPEAFEGEGHGHSSPTGVPAIEFREVDLAFDEQVVLDKVSFSVRHGETKIVLGGSGTGKSTIINLILGLLKPDAGGVYIDGEDITAFDDMELM